MTVELRPSDAQNARLLEAVHPSGWVNPTPAGRYHLVVLGAGTAGLVAAAGAAGLGAKVALIERGLMGGDCLNVGCVPSKALLRSARAAAQVRDAGRYGVHVPDGVRVDFAAVMERMRRLRADLAPHDSADRFRRLGVDVFFGDGRFTGPDAVEVAGQTLRFRRAVIATGSRPATPPVAGLAEAGFLTNETVFSLTELPARLAVIGAGPIGCELAQAFARFGSKVALLGNHAQVLPREDADAAELVARSLARDGVELVLRCEVRRVEVGGPDKVLHLKCGDEVREVAAEAILVGVGRVPNVDGLNLEAAGVEYDRRAGVQVDDRLRTTNPRVYAAGDVGSKYKFTHAADAMARVVVRNALFPFGRAKASALTIPWCTYTDPEVAHVGLYEREAKERGIAVRAFVQELRDVDRAVLDGEAEGFVRVLVAEGSDRILGATVVSSHAGEMISEITLAMAGNLGLKAVAGAIHPYPTQAEAVKKAADAFNRTRLTPRVKWLLGKWFAWTR
jgi:pyruvate/2-oxoglutarate dehydrogenase complex dihydrolipoamide dehydrogenase (E3) component